MDRYCSKNCKRKLFEKLEFLREEDDYIVYRVIWYCPVPHYMKAGHDEYDSGEVWKKRKDVGGVRN